MDALILFPAEKSDTSKSPVEALIDGRRYFRVDASTADRPDVPDAVMAAVAGDALSMAALRQGATVWVAADTEVANGVA